MKQEYIKPSKLTQGYLKVYRRYTKGTPTGKQKQEKGEQNIKPFGIPSKAHLHPNQIKTLTKDQGLSTIYEFAQDQKFYIGIKRYILHEHISCSLGNNSTCDIFIQQRKLHEPFNPPLGKF